VAKALLGVADVHVKLRIALAQPPRKQHLVQAAGSQTNRNKALAVPPVIAALEGVGGD